MSQYLKDSNNVCRLLQGFRGKSVPGGVQVHAFDLEISQNLLESILQNLGLQRVTFFCAEHQIVGIEARFSFRKRFTDGMDFKKGFLGPYRQIDRAGCFFRFDRA